MTWRKFLNNFEVYLGACCFAVLMVLLFAQVVSRYVFSRAITWCEELATMVFMWMIYCGVSGSVLKRRHLSIEFVTDLLPFKLRKVVLILDNVITQLFCIYIIFPMTEIIANLASSGARSPLLGMNRAACYTVAPVCLVLTVIRYVQENMILARENENELGAPKPVLDVAALEQEYLENTAKGNAAPPQKGAG